eukprot:Nitzschia sp. Nitz4//scaffold76_size158648//139716//141200//NITZ4_002569-RA/size158648-processed-gene-0.254-mRNA-1//1//CDS//3329557914//8998//frame0
MMDNTMDMRSNLVVMYKKQQETNVSSLSLGDKSYIMDLAQQKHSRKELREEEAMEEALELFQAALEEGAPKSIAMFKSILKEVLKELDEQYKEKDRLQDEWLEAAIQDEAERQQQEAELEESSTTSALPDYSEHTAGAESTQSSFQAPPTKRVSLRGPGGGLQRRPSQRMVELDCKIYEEDRNILNQKLNKAMRMMQDLIDTKGEAEAKKLVKYQNLKKKVKEYRTNLKKSLQEEATIRSTNGQSVMYDWGLDPVEEPDKEDSSTSSEVEDTDDQRAQAQEDLEWAKSIIANLSIEQQTSPEKDKTNNETNNDELELEKTPRRRTRHKNQSMSTIMATTRRVVPASAGMGKQSPERPWKSPLPAPKKESPVPTSPHFVKDFNKGGSSPGKRKSPSWKSPVKKVETPSIPLAPPFVEAQESPVKQETKPSRLVLKDKYTLQEFQLGKVPSDIDMSNWETYLVPEDFVCHFGMSAEKFATLAKWRQLEAKRKIRTW